MVLSQNKVRNQIQLFLNSYEIKKKFQDKIPLTSKIDLLCHKILFLSSSKPLDLTRYPKLFPHRCLLVFIFNSRKAVSSGTKKNLFFNFFHRTKLFPAFALSKNFCLNNKNITTGKYSKTAKQQNNNGTSYKL